jgi:SPASM domain peptide maturase of grasp-with-spasm system
METTSTYFKLFAHNIPVKGKDKGAIYDLQKQQIIPIPNIMCDILTELNEDSVENITKKYAPDSPELIHNYLNIIKQKDLGCEVFSLAEFPNLSYDWMSSSPINVAVVEHTFEHYNLHKILFQLDELLCKHLEFRLTLPTANEYVLEKMLDFVEGNIFKSMTLLLDYQSVDMQKMESAFEKCKKIDLIVVHDSPFTIKSEQHPRNILFTELSLEEMKAQTQGKYIVNRSYFMESQHYNPYYNRKVCIDRFGNIKNSLTQDYDFGNVNQQSLKDVVMSENFQTLWHAKPDRVMELKDSALRYATCFTDDLEIDTEHEGFFKVKEPSLVSELIS